jgi:hypothetical protein
MGFVVQIVGLGGLRAFVVASYVASMSIFLLSMPDVHHCMLPLRVLVRAYSCKEQIKQASTTFTISCSPYFSFAIYALQTCNKHKTYQQRDLIEDTPFTGT